MRWPWGADAGQQPQLVATIRGDAAEASSGQGQHSWQDVALRLQHRLPHGSPYVNKALICAGPGERTLANNLSWLRRFAVTLLKRHPDKDSIRGKMLHCGYSTDFL